MSMLVDLSAIKKADRILVHTCCAPCLAGILPEFIERFAERHYLFFNPNIHPFSEFEKRRSTLVSFLEYKKEGALTVFEYEPEVYFAAVRGAEKSEDRCRFCYRLRLQEAARFASDHGFSYFTTTILSSPYQKHEEAVAEGERAAEVFDLAFVVYPPLENYYDGVNEIRRLGLYYQWYCGCIYSEMERVKERGKPR